MTKNLAKIGIVGTAVMGRNLAMNMADKGFAVAVWNRNQDTLKEALDGAKGSLRGADSLRDLVQKLERPRRLMLMIKAGPPVDAVLDQLLPIMEAGDIIIDGGNSWYEDTNLRQARAVEKGVHFLGVGVSGGEEGARFGPSMMPGGNREAYDKVAPIFEAIAAKTNSGDCVTYVGPGGAGHFVKMVHNGIEYADMQCLAETYDLLHRLVGLDAPAMAEVFQRWNSGPLESFLVEITAKILTVKNPSQDGWLIDQVLDKAGQKGTGRWTAQVALDLGVPVPSIAAAIDARVLSSMKGERLEAEPLLQGPKTSGLDSGEQKKLVDAVSDALYAAKIVAYAQGMSLIQRASTQLGWGIDLQEMARIWKGGCIIRAQLLDTIMSAYERAPVLPNLMLDDTIRNRLHDAQDAWRRVVGLAQAHGIPVPAMASALSYFDSYRTARLPQNLTQAQRDAFGAHTYQTVDAPNGEFVHTDWLG